jgi:hypothetical protein
MGKTAMICTVLGWTVALAWSASATHGAAPADVRANSANKKRQPRFTISSETTYVFGPVRKDGTIDYPSALNERLRQGVTADTNANVLLWHAFGPHPEGATMPAEFFQWMGIASPPEKGEYYIDFIRFARDRLKVDLEKDIEELIDEMERGTARPWTRWQCPRLAAWLKANDQPLALVAEGARRPHYYSPLVPGGSPDGPGPLIATLLPAVQKCREFAGALSTRAMLHLGEGRSAEAWQDLQTCHRLGRHVAKGGTLIEGLVGIAIDNIATGADVVFLDNAPLNAKRAERCLRDLQQLPPMPTIAGKVDLSERFTFLDMVMVIDRRGIEYFADLIGRDDKTLPAKLPADVNWDPALRAGNYWFDRLTAVLRVEDRVVRGQRMAQLEKGLVELRVKFSKPGVVDKALMGEKSTPETRGEVLGEVLVTLLIPAVVRVQFAAERCEQNQRNLQVAFALAQYRCDYGHYPSRLTLLAPRYLTDIPSDLFRGKALTYLPLEDGYLLYSFGINGQDDQGRSYDDDPPGDDLRVRLPLPPLPAK